MKLNYDILWFEDRVDFVNEDLGPRLTDHLEELGFALKIDLRARYNPGDSVDYRAYDLVICDLNLPGATPAETTGRMIVNSIRSYKVLTEVLLYSEDAKLLKSQFRNLGLIERASFQAGRKELYNKVVRVIELTIRKVQTLSNVRGLVISETIDIESKMEALLLSYFKPTGEEALDSIKIGRVKSFLESKGKYIQKSLALVRAYDHKEFEGLCSQQFVATFDFIVLLDGIIKDTLKRMKAASVSADRIAATERLRREFSSIKVEVNDIRNTLAHVKEELQKDGTVVLKSRRSDGKPLLFNDDWCKLMRKSLHKHSKNLDGIEKALSM